MSLFLCLGLPQHFAGRAGRGILIRIQIVVGVVRIFWWVVGVVVGVVALEAGLATSQEALVAAITLAR